MKLRKSIKLAFNILVHSKLRSWLAIVGIVIGVASVIAIMSISAGMQKQIQDNLNTLGADMISVSKGSSRAFGAGGEFRGPGHDDDDNSGSIRKVKNLTNTEVQALKLVPNIAYVEGIVSARGDISYLGQTMSISAEGVDTNVWKFMVTTGLESGRYLMPGDKYVVVIGSGIAEGRFKQDIQINRQVEIEGKLFRVVGILKAETGFGGHDNSVIMPIDIARETLEGLGKKEFNSISIKVKDANLISETEDAINKRLMLVRAESDTTKSFSVSSIKATQETITSTLNSVALFLGAIAAVSLLVGAVGIANTMFTTVLEKTKEIGIMKAIGAKNKDIMFIFLFNAGMIGFAGGIIGVIFGIILSNLVPYLLGGGMIPGRMNLGATLVTPQLALFVFSFSIMIGIIAGIIPAYRASKMDPVEALRYE